MPKYFPLSAAVVFAITGAALAQHRAASRLGIFEAATDIGTTVRGSAQFDAATRTYRMSGGAGAEALGARDVIHYAWCRMSEDGTLSAVVRFPSQAKPASGTAVLMFRQSLDADAIYAAVAIDEDGHVTLQYRAVRGAGTQVAMATAEQGAAKLVLQRQGDAFTGYAASADGEAEPFASAVVAIHDPVYVGIGVGAQDGKGPPTVTFSDLHLVQTGVFAPVRLNAPGN